MMIIVGGMARFSPALIYRRFFLKHARGGGAVPLTAYNVYFWCSHEMSLPPVNHLIKKLILLKLETKTYSTSRLGWEVAPWHPLAPSFKSISEKSSSRKTLKIGCQWVPGCQAYTFPFPFFFVRYFTPQSRTPFLSSLANHFVEKFELES